MSEDHSRGGSGGMQIGSLCPQAEGTYYDYTYMSAGIQMEEYRDDWHYMQYSIELEEGRDSRDNPIRLMLYKDGSYLSPEEDPDADTWKVTAAAMLDPVTQSPPLWRASGSSGNTELVTVAEDWTADTGYVTYQRAGGEGAQAAISVRLIFDNGASALLEDSLLVGRDGWVRGSGGAIFESLGFRYFGPIDGNDIEQVTETLRRLRDLKGPRILHVITRKGKGYAPAEADPTTWHAPGRFDPATGARLKTTWPAARYQDVFGEVLVDLARLDPKVVGITPAMATGCGMNRLETVFPDRFFDVGIEEEHAVTFSAGLAAAGMKPYCNIYSSFAQRAAWTGPAW